MLHGRRTIMKDLQVRDNLKAVLSPTNIENFNRFGKVDDPDYIELKKKPEKFKPFLTIEQKREKVINRKLYDIKRRKEKELQQKS